MNNNQTGTLFIAGSLFQPAGFSFGAMASVTADGEVTFNWPLIEQTASDTADAPSRSIARLLLAARNETGGFW